MIRRVVLALGSLLCAASVSAATLDGVTLPDHYPVEGGSSLALNGIAVRTLTVFNVKVYVAGLYLQQPSHDPQQIMKSRGPKVLLLQFLHAGSKAEIEKEYRAGEVKNCGAGGCNPADEADFEHLVSAAPAVAVGDTSTYIFTDRGFRVLANNKTIGEYNNPDLGERILAGFIGQYPPSAEVRSALLGLTPE